MHRFFFIIFLTATLALMTADDPKEKFNDPLKPFVENFKGRGALNDGSTPSAPEEALKKLQMAEGLTMQVVAHEPAVAQPLNIYFDERGRMWVTQYLQYPFPAGLKIVTKSLLRLQTTSKEKTKSQYTRTPMEMASSTHTKHFSMV